MSSSRGCRGTPVPRPVSSDTRPGRLQCCVPACQVAGGPEGRACPAATHGHWGHGRLCLDSRHRGHSLCCWERARPPRGPQVLGSEDGARRQLPVTCPRAQARAADRSLAPSVPDGSSMCTHAHTRACTRALTTGSRCALCSKSPVARTQQKHAHAGTSSHASGARAGWRAPRPAAAVPMPRVCGAAPCMGVTGDGRVPNRAHACAHLLLHGRTGTISGEHGTSCSCSFLC